MPLRRFQVWCVKPQPLVFLSLPLSCMFIRSSSRSITSNISSTGTRFHQASISSTRLSRYPGRSSPKLTKRASSSIPPPDDHPSPSSSLVPDTQPSLPSLPEGDVLEIEKPKRKRTVISAKPPSGNDPADSPSFQTENAENGSDGSVGGNGNTSTSSSQLPTSLDILWSPEPHPTASDLQNPDLPPSEIFEGVLDNLHVTLHPKTQHRATYSPQDGSANSIVEPTLALYCPIEGGDYVVDKTVEELARKVGADVVVLDCVQLAAGSAGQFGPGPPFLLHAQSRMPYIDYMRAKQLQTRFSYLNTPFISNIIKLLHHLRPPHTPQNVLRRPQRMTTPTTPTSSPLHT